MKGFVSGNIYINSTIWLPAYQNCQLKCRIDSEICQMSGPTVHIRRQRCYELPLECRRHLKKLVGGAELFTKPNHRIWGNLSSKNDKRSKENKKQKNIKKENTNLLKTTNLPLNYGEGEFLLPLSQDKDLTTSTKFIPFSTKSQFISSTKKSPTTIKIINDLKSTTKFDNTLQLDFEMFYAEKQILDKDKLKNNNSSSKSPKNLQKIEIFGPPIRGPIPHPSAPEDAFILNHSTQKQTINEAKENIFDNNNSKPPKVLPWWTWKKLAVQNENGKKSIVEDLTNQCCQWALDGLCDRTFEGTLSCSRVLDVDVIGCYEQRKQNYFISANSNLGQSTSTKFTKGKDEIINERKIVYRNDNFVEEFKQKSFVNLKRK
uniref:Uncharacterized protein n=1 Tax=Meloidogyne floridensis TaxID=298350 RepID=A0A915NTH3_9BILA